MDDQPDRLRADLDRLAPRVDEAAAKALFDRRRATEPPHRGRVLAAATRDIEIGKSGFERFVALAARRHSLLYGLVAVLLSLGLGWAAATVFRRRI